MARPLILAPAALLAALLAGCGQSMPPEQAKSAAKAPAPMDMPKLDANGATIPFTGSTLPPGSRVTSMMVGAHEGAEMGKTMIDFESPLTPERTRDWFIPMLRDHRYKITANGANLSGHDPQGTPFRIDLKPLPGGRSAGMLASG